MSIVREELVCARNGCDERFTPRTHNQKYHHNDCCILATNERLMVNYYKRRAREKGELRICNSCGITKLNRYNESDICSGCKSKNEVEAKRTVLQMLSGISWQTS